MTDAQISEFVAQRFAIGKQIHLTDFEGVAESARIVVSRPWEMGVDRLVIGIKAWCLAERHEGKSAEVKHYVSWWDHFKASYFPGPLLSRFPAATWTETVFEPLTVRVCPHIHIPEAKNNTYTHMAFLNPEKS